MKVMNKYRIFDIKDKFTQLNYHVSWTHTNIKQDKNKVNILILDDKNNIYYKHNIEISELLNIGFLLTELYNKLIRELKLNRILDDEEEDRDKK